MEGLWNGRGREGRLEEMENFKERRKIGLEKTFEKKEKKEITFIFIICIFYFYSNLVRQERNIPLKSFAKANP